MSATAERTARRLALLSEVPLAELPGIGARNAKALSELEMTSVLDLVMNYPRRHADRTNTAEISDLRPGDEANVRASVQRVNLARPRGRRPFVSVTLSDEDGSTLGVTFFNQPWRARQLEVGMEVVCFGKADVYRGGIQMTNPRVDIVGARDDFKETGRMVPIYRASEKAGLASYQIARFVNRALAYADDHDAFADPLSPERRARLGLIGRKEAFHAIHHPSSLADKEDARRRLAFDELWRMQVVLVLKKRATLASAKGIRHLAAAGTAPALVEEFRADLPFALTAAQARAIEQIVGDLRGAHPMNRLLQGDVGAGKTIVALYALLYGIQSGHQGALMVPTEVLAEQHFFSANALVAHLNVPDATRLSGTRPVGVALLTSKTTAAERSALLRELKDGTTDLLVGTHALLTEDVRFSSLGVVVIDEQHRFGVDQRAALREKGSEERAQDPDLLVMTATPIPRTAAMTVYGDLDYSVFDELPPGRSPIATRWIAERDDEHLAWERVRAEVEAGHAAYVVCPLVRAGDREEGDDDPAPEDSANEVADNAANDAAPSVRTRKVPAESARVLRAATEEFERLSVGELQGLRLGLMHGQLSAREKEGVMARFRDGALDVLVATTVVEVGVDVPRATVMVIEDADRFGIAQLHQLRGRVGRADRASYCYLLSPDASPQAEKRLGALVATSDGFELAEVDLELRGEGTVLGVRQKGRSDLRLASLRRDKDLVGLAREVALEIIDADPFLANHPRFSEEIRSFIDETEAEYLVRA